MKKPFLLFIFLGLFIFNGRGQNLVPNAHFEQYSGCPDNINEFDSLLYWFNPTGASPDYHNHCANPTSAGVPNNLFGFQYAHSGMGYCGIHRWIAIQGNYREYIEIQLLSPLVANICYHLRFYINLADEVIYTSDAIGAYFSDTLVTDMLTNSLLPCIPQINNTAGNVPDNLTWKLVLGNFIAAGGENYLVIGNFNNDANTTVTVANSGAFLATTYIYIDDVCLRPCSNPCTTETDIEEQNSNSEIKIYPNPVKEEILVSGLRFMVGEKAEIIITDVLGKLIYRNQFSQPNFKFQVSNFKSGIYFIEINDGKNIYRKKFLKE